jgi:hypothetical protein
MIVRQPEMGDVPQRGDPKAANACWIAGETVGLPFDRCGSKTASNPPNARRCSASRRTCPLPLSKQR